MCLTTHFTAQLLKSCAVYTHTNIFEYLSSGQFNYPGPSVISTAFVVSLSLSLLFAAGVRDLSAASLRYGRLCGKQKRVFLLKYRPRLQILYTSAFL